MLAWVLVLHAALLLIAAASEERWKDDDKTCSKSGTGSHDSSPQNFVCSDPSKKGKNQPSQIQGNLVNESFTIDSDHPWASVLLPTASDLGIAKNEVVSGLTETLDGGFARKIPKQAYDPFAALYNSHPPGIPMAPPFVGQIPSSTGMCPNLGSLEHGKSSDEQTPMFQPGSVVDFSCDKGYYLIGAQRLTCLLTERWSDDKPSCVTEVSCGDIGAPKAGTVNYMPPLKSDDQIKAVLSLPVFNGQSLPQQMMDLVTTEPGGNHLGDQQNRDLPPGRYAPGTRAIFNCRPKYYRMEGSKTRICKKNGKWSGRETVCIPECGVHMEGRVHRGANATVAPLMRWPWQTGIGVYLDNMKQWILQCGGTLINEEWVMTAAHCVSQSGATPVPLNVVFTYLGKYYRDDSKDDQHVQYRSPRKIVIHPDYNPSQFDSDIALIWLLKPVELTERVQPACLPSKLTSDMNLERGERGVVPGWGKTQDGEFLSIMHELSLPVIENHECAQKYRNEGHAMLVTERMFCAGVDDGHIDACGGDSGGPMLFQDKISGKWVVEGIVSWGSPEGCAVPRQYGGYTRVAKFLDWLHLYF